MASQAQRLAEQVSAGETGRAARLPRQLAHGDFWDDNVLFQGRDPAFVADFGFLAERARIDDLALTLHDADTQFGLATSQVRIAALRPLMHTYASGRGKPRTDFERQALPWAIARRLLRSIGGWVATLDDEHAIKTCQKMTTMSRRGFGACRSEWLLAAAAHNLRKLHAHRRSA